MVVACRVAIESGSVPNVPYRITQRESLVEKDCHERVAELAVTVSKVRLYGAPQLVFVTITLSTAAGGLLAE